MCEQSWGRGVAAGAFLVLSGCSPFEWPEKFTEPKVLADGGSGETDAGVFASDFTSCPEFSTPPQNADGGMAPAFVTLKVDLQTSIGLVDVYSALPVGCQLPATATAMLSNMTAVMPQPTLAWTTGDGGVLSVDASGVVTGNGDGVTSLEVSAQGKTGTRPVWVGGDALLTIAPQADYGGFPESLHGTAAAGTVSGGNLLALFAMRRGTGLDAVERAMLMQGGSVTLIEGQDLVVRITYREFGEKLPGRVRDFSGTVPVHVEQRTPGHARLSFTDAVLRGPKGAAFFSGHLEFSTP
jgi:hypothetical protein